MVQCSKFKPEVFGCLMISILCLALFMTSVITNEWVKGNASNAEDSADYITVNFGLFSGHKEKNRGTKINTDLSVVCYEGVCMYSCGGIEDIKDILKGKNSSEDTSSGDNICKEKGWENEANSAGIDTNGPIAENMIKFGLWLSTIIFFFIGLTFSLINIVLVILNTAHNPVSSILGIDGLVIWNIGSSVSYLLVLILWGALFSSRISENLCISETLRVNGLQWSSAGQSSLGYSYWLVFPTMILHMVNAGILGYRQYAMYYAPKSRNAKNLQMRVQESADGKDMLY
ncbi:uncharacterized protein LOC111710232 [Eurytemora carolleeae]|uniref:uncharacterized protein LOC111710232 n=1 Tax=Eurytemora carolleeae TaxID=1294199 RepID=UPI000C782E81|nr:uncharacterized protein LOC111710232 [Eurytemora carolleeae]|eukprot:XP_023340064.1 uncharacterized protein LOC111710232 [Eurytemora affinis]